MKSTARVEIVVFDGIEELDALGPYEVFSVARQAGADIEVRLVTYKEVDRIRAAHGLVFTRKAGSMKAPTSWLSREEGGVALLH